MYRPVVEISLTKHCMNYINLIYGFKRLTKNDKIKRIKRQKLHVFHVWIKKRMEMLTTYKAFFHIINKSNL
jgi:hypothetical protein